MSNEYQVWDMTVQSDVGWVTAAVPGWRAITAVDPAPELEAWAEQACASIGTVTLTMEQHADMVAERDRLRAEVERLRALNDDLARQVTSAELEVATLHRRLRNGREEVAAAAGAAPIPLDTAPADHRLGLPQPDGEPCTPMSARAWRWLP